MFCIQLDGCDFSRIENFSTSLVKMDADAHPRLFDYCCAGH